MTKKIAILLLVFLSHLSIVGQTLSFRNYTVNSGLANSTVYYIHQDSKGFIWFATESGVNRYDGHIFQTFTMDDGLADNEILQIREDSRGRIWFLSLNGKLSYYQNNKFYNARNAAFLKHTFCKASFVSFFEDSRKRLWFSTNQREILMLDGVKAKIYSSAQQILTNAFIAESERSEILIFSQDHIYQLDKEKFIELHPKLKPISFKTIHYDAVNKRISYLSAEGLTDLIGGKSKLRDKIQPSIVKSPISNILFDENALWINTMGKGSYLLRYKPIKAPQNLLKGRYITHSIRDADGNIWISTIGNGVYMLPESARDMQHYTTWNGLRDNSVYSVLMTPNHKLVLGLKNGDLNIIEQGRISYRKLNLSAASYNPVKELYYDPQNKSIWFASNNTLGEIGWEKPSLRFLRERDNLTYALKNFSISKKGKLAIALAAGVDVIPDKNADLVFETPALNKPKLHFPSRAYSVFYDSDERLWFSNINGLQCATGSEVNELYRSNALLRERITDILELPGKRIVCASYGFGVFILDSLKLTKVITTKDGLASNICKKVFYANNNLWVITGKGISRIPEKFDKITNYQKENGLLSNEINDAEVHSDSIFVASNSGLSILNINKASSAEKSIPLNLNYVLNNNVKIDASKRFSLSYKSNNIKVSFVAIDYINPGQIIYKYRLKDESKWISTSNNTLDFGSLESGDYRLQIMAKGLNSGWSEPIVVDFEIRPPFWKTNWFIILLILVLVPAIAGLINSFFRRKRLKERERLLARTKIIALEQQALQAMMNPHFIFNVMNSIQHFINTQDTVMANQLLTGFARLIRKNLDICNKSFISIEEELGYLNLYLKLEKLRFGEKLQYNIDVDPDIDIEETMIPSMLLQPFVENAIWHGIMPKETNGNINITIRQTKSDKLYISITDDGIGIENSLKEKSNDHISKGMALTEERINLLNKFDTSISLNVEQLQPEGTKVTIFISNQPLTQ